MSATEPISSDAHTVSTGAKSPDPPPSWYGVFGAWWLLLIADVLLHVFGFNVFHSFVRRWPTIGAVSGGCRAALARRACAGVRRARVYYIRRARCLQTAAAAVFLLRLGGIDARLVIGVRRIPFYAHAWVEVDGEVVLNAQRDMQRVYEAIASC